MTKFEIYISRLQRYFKNLDRIGIMWYFVVGFIVILLLSLFGFTVIHHEFYAKMAEAQQKTVIKNPISRGTISSSAESLNGTVAVSTNLGTLAVDPSQSGSKVHLLDLLSEAVVLEFCSHRTAEECQQNIFTYTRTQELPPAPPLAQEELKTRVKKYLDERMSTPIESVLIAENLADDAVLKINNLDNPALYFASNNLYVNPTRVQASGSLAAALSPIIGQSREEIEPKFAIREKRHLEVIRKMSIGTRDMIVSAIEKNRELTNEQINIFVTAARDAGADTKRQTEARLQAIAENAIYPFIKIEDNLVRYYPEGSALGQITGFVDGEWRGQYGIEGYFERDLQGENPTQVVTKDSQWRPIRDYVSSGALVLQNGANISLTIDRSIQKEISKRLEAAAKRFGANRVSAIVTDPKTGAIISMVNYPSYDPNQFNNVHELEPIDTNVYKNPAFQLFGFPMFVIDSQSGTISHTIDGKLFKLREATEAEGQNNAIQKFKYKNGYGIGNYQNPVLSYLYEPGSVFKAITVAIGLDTGEIKPNTRYYDRNYVELDVGGGVKRRISNASPAKCGGTHTFANALNWSCNVGMINIVEKVGRSLFDSYMRDFGFGAKTNISLDGEVFSNIPAYDKWSRTQFFTMSFGQGISTTMIQMASAYNVLANGGIYMKPYIVESITYPNGKKVDTVPLPLKRVIKEETSKTVTAMLADGAKNGYAAKGAVEGYAIAGKSGTSQIPYKGTYENAYFNSWQGHTVTSYGGYAPAYNPKFVMIVVIERPRSDFNSETTAAVLWKELAEYLLTYYKVPKWQ